MLGVVAAYRFELSEVRKDFGQALRLDPRNTYYHLYYGVLLRRTGDRSGAVRELLTAERLDPSDARAYVNLGALYMPRPAVRKPLGNNCNARYSSIQALRQFFTRWGSSTEI